MNELTIGDKTYISSKRAAEITGYAKDYVGQLCREGHVEAKMVGRSWYVLEESIKKHRFGEENKTEIETSEIETPEEELGLPSTWEAPRYSSEPIAQIPIQEKPVPTATVGLSGSQNTESGDKTLSDMQAAWKEWFDTRPEKPLIESPQVIEARDAGYEEEASEPLLEAPRPVIEPEEATPIAVHKLHEPEPVQINRPQAPIKQELTVSRPVAAYKPRKQRTNFVTVAILVVIAGIAVTMAAIGSGLAGNYITDNAIVKFIGGTRTLNK